jgi:urocanate hydratase
MGAPLAVTMNEGVALVVEVDPWRIERRLALRHLDVATEDLEEAMTWAEEARRAGEAKSIGLLGNAAQVLPELVTRGSRPDVVTDQTSAHDPLMGYIPTGLTLDQATTLREANRQAYLDRAMASMAAHVEAMLAFQRAGAVVFDYGNNLRQRAYDYGVKDAFAYPGFVPAFIRPLFCEGSGPFRWVALSGDPEDIYETDRIILNLFPENDHLRRWITMAEERVAWQGLPARICWLKYGERVALVWRSTRRWPTVPARRSSSGAITSTRARWLRPTARPSPCATAPTPSPTGPS